MPRLAAINPADAAGKTKELLDGVQAKFGKTPNMMRTFANSAAALKGYLDFGAALATGKLDAKFREQIALAVAQANSCEYCLAAHTAIGKMVGLTETDILASREAQSRENKRDAGLRFAQALVVRRGEVSDDAIKQVKAGGYSDGEIAEIVANVALNILTNYFNHVAQTEVDFPKVDVSLAANA